jgi:CheY-like chemotaxis protein/HPt (histidine-containing phosphotransfer) domain-containing protein
MMRIGSKPIEFDLEVDEKLPVLLFGDELRVKQILNNLLSNAFKYTDAGTVKMSVDAGAGKDDTEIALIISVADTGQGMTKEQVGQLFDEFSRFNLEANRTTEGTGLGMNITKNLIKMMDGEIKIESEPGKGSTFIVSIPQGKSSAELLGSEMAENLHQFRSNSRAQMKRAQIVREYMPYGSVLIVDDVGTNIFVAKGLMTNYGLKLDSAESGFGAIQKVKEDNVYDIIFMDHMMPGMDGIEATKKLREMKYDHPVVALTANAVAGQAEIFLGNGFDDFISKPIDVRQLNTVLNKLIRDKQPPEVLEEARKQAAARAGSAPNRSKPDEDKPILDPRLIEAFIRDAKKSHDIIEKITKKGKGKAKGKPFSEEDIRTYVIHTHGMKSALANIGNMELSAVALKLETSGRDGNHDIVVTETPGFLASLKDYITELTPKEDTSDIVVDEDRQYLHEQLLKIKAACEEYDENTADKVLHELRQKPWSPPTKEMLGTFAEHFLISEFEEVVEIIDKFVV